MILAGGRSTRMGQDKALMRLPSGQTLLSQTVTVVRSLTADIKIVTPWPEKYISSVSVEWLKEPLPVYEPENRLTAGTRQRSSAGPLSGFAHGMSQVCTDWCLLLACDMPYLETAALQGWWDWIVARQQEGWSARSQPIACLSPMDDWQHPQRWEPLCGYYHRSCKPSLQQQVGQGQRSFQSWLSTVPIAPYEAAPKRLFFNCNRPDDWPFES
ncbi:MAG: NTP transferase domain-containing protein [Cyanobacteria bacterium J06606_4]